MSENRGTEAREQATEYDSPFADRVMVFDDKSTLTIPPHPQFRLLDDDALEALDAYQEEIETEYDREPDVHIGEQKATGRDGNEITLPPETIKGAVKNVRGAYFKDGKRVSPPHEVRMVQIALGSKDYELLRSKTINGKRAGARDVWRAWNEQGLAVAKRAVDDSKSDSSTVVLEDDAEADSE